MKRTFPAALILALVLAFPGVSAHADSGPGLGGAQSGTATVQPLASNYFNGSPQDGATVGRSVNFVFSWSGGGGCCEGMNLFTGPYKYSSNPSDWQSIGFYGCNINCGSGTASIGYTSGGPTSFYWKVCPSGQPVSRSCSTPWLIHIQ